MKWLYIAVGLVVLFLFWSVSQTATIQINQRGITSVEGGISISHEGKTIVCMYGEATAEEIKKYGVPLTCSTDKSKPVECIGKRNWILDCKE